MTHRSQPPPLDGERVLIVEDRYLTAADVAAEIERLGGRVLGPARDVSAARAVIAREKADLALLDVNLGDGAVFPLVSELVERGVPFIFLTGYIADALPAEWRDRPCLRKPLDARALRDEIARLRPEAPATKG